MESMYIRISQFSIPSEFYELAESSLEGDIESRQFNDHVFILMSFTYRYYPHPGNIYETSRRM